MKLPLELFEALIEYIDAKADYVASPDEWSADRVIDARSQLEDQLKGDHDEAQP